MITNPYHFRIPHGSQRFPTFHFKSKTRQGAVAKGVGLSYSKNAGYCQHVKDIPWVGEQPTTDVVKVIGDNSGDSFLICSFSQDQPMMKNHHRTASLVDHPFYHTQHMGAGRRRCNWCESWWNSILMVLHWRARATNGRRRPSCWMRFRSPVVW